MKLGRDTPELAVTTGRAQGEFLDTLNRLEPRVLETLHGEPLRIYRQTPSSLAGYDWASLKEWTQLPEPEEPDLVDTRRAVEAWAEPWGLLEQPWVLTAACRTLDAWRQGSKLKIFHRGGFGVIPATPLSTRDIFPGQVAEQFKEFMGWEPTYEKATEFRDRFLTMCKEFVDEHISTQTKIADERNYGKAPAKHKLELHLEWLVRYQVQGWRQVQITEHYPKTEGEGYELYNQSNISDALNRTAALVKLILKAPDFPEKDMSFTG